MIDGQNKPAKRVYYLAHPVSGDVESNLANVREWLRVLIDKFPEIIVVAPWYGEVASYINLTVTPDFYARVIADDMDVVAKLDGIIGVGGSWTPGMMKERLASRDAGGHIVDLSQFWSPADVLDWGAVRAAILRT